MLNISKLFIYPIKSLRGISVQSALVTDRGLQYDRRWMIVDENNKFLSLRTIPKMALLKVEMKDGGMKIISLEHAGNDFQIQFDHVENDLESVTIWNATVEARRVGKDADGWFSEMLGVNCKLVFMPDNSKRPVNTTSGFAPQGKFTSFADAYPFLMVGQSSMDDLNLRMQIPLAIERFRPNIVFSGGFPYQEDGMEDFKIGQINFTGLENCKRCMVPNIDPDKGVLNSDKEPTKTLSEYRLRDKKIEFGRNVVHQGSGLISVGDEIHLNTKPELL